MGKNKICVECGSEIKDSKKQKLERGSVIRMLKMIKIASIEETDEETKKMCYDCWKKQLRSVMKPFAQSLGKNAEDW